MLSRDVVLAPNVVTVRFALSPVFSAIEIMHLMMDTEEKSGLSDWLSQTVKQLTPEQRELNELIFTMVHPLFYVTETILDQYKSIEEFIADLKSHAPLELRDKALSFWAELPKVQPDKWPAGKTAPTPAQLLNKIDVFIEYMSNFDDCDEMDAIWRRAHALIQSPQAMVDTLTGHLQWMWDTHIKAEWERKLPMLTESLNAFQKMDYRNLTALEAIRTVTGRDMSSRWDDKMDGIDNLVFVPSAHIGPYIAMYSLDKTNYIMFGARLPRGAAVVSPDLSRAELLVRLNALADDTRLRILELLTRNEEMFAQDIIERLGLSQPTISRHLSQLSATGFITERRRDVAKVYSLNSDRVNDTLRALSSFLTRQ